MSEFKFPLGIEVKDKLTGFKGIISYRAQYLTGCNQYGIQAPVDKDGKKGDNMQSDENIIEVVGKGMLTTEEYASFKGIKAAPNFHLSNNTGGPQPSAQKR